MTSRHRRFSGLKLFQLTYSLNAGRRVWSMLACRRYFWIGEPSVAKYLTLGLGGRGHRSHHKLLDKSRIGGISPIKFRVVLRERRGSPGGRGLCRDVNPMSAQTTTTRERAPLLLVFGSLADRVAEILRSRPSLTARIAFAPPEAIHAIAAFLYLAPEATGSDAEVGNLIEQSDPRELLRKAIPDCPARLYRALDRAGSSYAVDGKQEVCLVDRLSATPVIGAKVRDFKGMSSRLLRDMFSGFQLWRRSPRSQQEIVMQWHSSSPIVLRVRSLPVCRMIAAGFVLPVRPAPIAGAFQSCSNMPASPCDAARMDGHFRSTSRGQSLAHVTPSVASP